MAGEVIAQLIAQAKNNVPSNACDLIFGRVTKAKPLEILVDEKYFITKDFMVLMTNVKKTIVKSVDGTVEVEVFKDLSVGEKVMMIKGQKNQVYYVLDRVV